MASSKNAKGHSCSKYIDIRYDYIREVVEKGERMLKYCPFERMLADILTKPLPKTIFEELRGLVGVKDCHSSGSAEKSFSTIMTHVLWTDTSIYYAVFCCLLILLRVFSYKFYHLS